MGQRNHEGGLAREQYTSKDRDENSGALPTRLHPTSPTPKVLVAGNL